MKKIILFTFCTFLSLASHAQTAAEKALEALFKPAVKEVSVAVSVTGRGAAFDLAQATSAIKNVISRQYGSRVTMMNLIRKAKAENRATIPAALLANEVLNKMALEFYNVGKDDGSLWYAYKPGIVESGQYRGPDATYRRLRLQVARYIESLKLELQLQTTSPVLLFKNEMDSQEKIDTIEELQRWMRSFAIEWLDPDRGQSFFTDGYEALGWLKYYYSALNGNVIDVPGRGWSGLVGK